MITFFVLILLLLICSLYFLSYFIYLLLLFFFFYFIAILNIFIAYYFILALFVSTISVHIILLSSKIKVALNIEDRMVISTVSLCIIIWYVFLLNCHVFIALNKKLIDWLIDLLEITMNLGRKLVLNKLIFMIRFWHANCMTSLKGHRTPLHGSYTNGSQSMCHGTMVCCERFLSVPRNFFKKHKFITSQSFFWWTLLFRDENLQIRDEFKMKTLF